MSKHIDSGGLAGDFVNLVLPDENIETREEVERVSSWLRQELIRGNISHHFTKTICVKKEDDNKGNPTQQHTYR